MAPASGGWATRSLVFVNGTNHSTGCCLSEIKAQSLALISTRLISMLGALCSTRTIREYIALAEGLDDCTSFSSVGREQGVDDPKASQITGMSDASQILGSCVCIIENVPNIKDHDFIAVIQYFRSRNYHMVVNQYVEHVMVGGCTIRKQDATF